MELKIKDSPSVKYEDLQKTLQSKDDKSLMNLLKKNRVLENEWMLYFDYKTGEIQCSLRYKENYLILMEIPFFE